MKSSAPIALLLALAVVAFSTQGFQCGSADLTSGKLYYGQYESSRDTSRLNLALAAFQNEVNARPNSAEGWYWVGLVYGVKKEYMRLADAWKNSLAVSNQMKRDIEQNRPYFWGQAFNSGVAALQKARATKREPYYRDAMNAMESAIAIEPDSSAKYGAYFTYAVCLVELKNWNEALPALQTAIEKENNPDAYRLKGTYYLNKGMEHRKIFDEQNAGAIAIKSKEAKLRKGIAAKEIVDILGEPASKEKTGRKSESWSYEKGYLIMVDDGKLASFSYRPGMEPKIDSTQIHTAYGEFERALDILKKGSDAHPQNDAIREAMINAYINLNRVQEAIDPLKAQIAKSPNDKQLRYVYGVLLLNLKRYDDAIAEFNKALELDPEYEDAIFNLSRAYVNQGVEMRDKAMQETSDPSRQSKEYLKKFEAALPHIEQYLKMQPEDADSWELAGRIYISLGKTEQATTAFEKADTLRKSGK